VPIRLDAATWPAAVGLVLGDPLYLNAADDRQNAVGQVPKVFTEEKTSSDATGFDVFVPLRGGQPTFPSSEDIRWNSRILLGKSSIWSDRRRSADRQLNLFRR
jgi:hypothetical protein